MAENSMMNGMEMDPAMVAALVQAGLLSNMERQNQSQTSMANELRQTPSPTGQHVGGTYVAPSPLSHLATGLNRIRGEIELSQARDAYSNLLKGTGANVTQSILDALRGRQQPQAPGVPQPGQTQQRPVGPAPLSLVGQGGQDPVGMNPSYT